MAIKKTNPDEAIQNKIDNYFNQLEVFINELPLNDKGKNYIWFDSFCKFYDEPVITEDGKTTYGIQTEWQLQQFIKQFKNNLQSLKIKVVEKYSEQLNELPAQIAVTKINKELHRIKQKEILTEIGGEIPNDWDKFLKKYLSNEAQYHSKPKYAEMKKSEFDFKKDLKTANNIEDIQERLLFLKKRLKEYNQYSAGGWHVDIEDKAKQYTEEITYVQELIKSEPQPAPPQKGTEPIKWNNDLKQLAYFFWKLKKENIIENKTLGLTLSKLFIDKNVKEIKNTIFNKHFSDFDNNNTFPYKAKEIDTLINFIKEFHKEV